MNYSPEVLIYLQTFKNYLQNNQDAKNYFLANLDEEEFYRHILEVSEKNFKKNGEPQLSLEQFEFLRVSLMIFKKVEEEEMKQMEDEDLIFHYSSKNIKFYFK
jgi:hypothetical protein